MNPFPKSLIIPLFFASALQLFPAGAGAPSGEKPWNITGRVPADEVIVQSHRGAGILTEENTIAAFEKGWALGTWPECDLRTTRDGVIVTFHDGNFARVVKGVSPEMAKLGVKDLAFAELLKLDVGAWKGDRFLGRKISTITDVFKIMQGRPGRHLYMDIKSVDLKQLAGEVKKYKVEKQVVFTTSKHELIREWKKLVPESETLLWMRGDEASLDHALSEIRKTGFEGITQLQVHIFPTKTFAQALEMAAIKAGRLKTTVEREKANPNQFTVSDDFVRKLGGELRARHILFQALPYTSDAGVCSALFDLGVASIATDYPDAVLAEIRKYYTRKAAARD